MANDTVKQISIDNGAGGFSTKPVGADSKNIDVYYDDNRKIVEGPTNITKNLAVSLDELDTKISEQVSRAEVNLIGDAVAEDSLDDQANGSHAKGSYFLYDGELARATDSIVQGGSLLNKYQSTDVGTELKSLKDSLDTNVTALTNSINTKANSSALGTQVTYYYENGVLTITPKA